jgi:hypothetical protein
MKIANLCCWFSISDQVVGPDLQIARLEYQSILDLSLEFSLPTTLLRKNGYARPKLQLAQIYSSRRMCELEAKAWRMKIRILTHYREDQPAAANVHAAPSPERRTAPSPERRTAPWVPRSAFQGAVDRLGHSVAGRQRLGGDRGRVGSARRRADRPGIVSPLGWLESPGLADADCRRGLR